MQPNRPDPPPRRLLALDPGERRVGVAISDELGLYAHPRPALRGDRQDVLIASVAELVAREAAAEVVVGLPLTLSGGDSDQTRAVRAFAAALRRRLPVPVTEWDERLSSTEAERSVKGRERRRSGELDSAAASIVLQAVLDFRRARAST